MRLAMFCAMWNEEIVKHYYSGLHHWAVETNNIVDVFSCYGRVGKQSAFNRGSYSIYDFPDLKDYDGIILMYTNINDEDVRAHIMDKIDQAGIPCVLLDYDMQGMSSIYMDQGSYIYQMVEHLVKEHGCQRFCYIGGPDQNLESEMRLDGFLRATADYGVEAPAKWQFKRMYDWNDGVEVAKILLRDRFIMPDAIVSPNDDMAARAWATQLEAGIQVGTQVKVTGFDRYFLGEYYAPTLTTIQRPKGSLAYNACKLLEDYHGEKHIKNNATLFFGQTCGCCGQMGMQQGDREFRRSVFKRFNSDSDFDGISEAMEAGVLGDEGVLTMVEAMRESFSEVKEGCMDVYLLPDLVQYSCYMEGTYTHATEVYNLIDDGRVKCKEANGNVYVYAPIHFMDHVYGYCRFRDIPFLLEGGNLRNLATTLGYSLELLVQRQRYLQANTELQKLYETDHLTGVYNRHGMHKHAEAMLEESRSKGQGFLAIFVDVDGLKKVNDVYGHEAGDVLIQLVGHSLTEVAPEEMKVFRYGGDEFLVLGATPSDEGFVDDFRRQVDARISRKAERMHLPYEVGASIGSAQTAPDEFLPLDQIIKNADYAMYAVKLQRHQQRK